MSRFKLVVLLAGTLTPICLSVAQDQASSSSQSHAKPEPVLDISSMDTSVDPCVDFFAYSCNGWIKKNPIPPDQSRWSAYAKLEDENRLQLRGILEEAAEAAERPAYRQKIGDYYASCMDEKTIDAAGASP